MTGRIAGATLALSLLGPLPAPAQFAPGHQGSPNLHVVAHIPLGGRNSISDIEMEQELSRPYAYVGDQDQGGKGFRIISLKDPGKARVIYAWSIEHPELHQGASLAPTYLKARGRYYFVNGFQFYGSGPDTDVGAIVWDVTGLPDTSTVKEVARIRSPNGFHETFSYRHSNGRALLFVQTMKGPTNVYDIEEVVGSGGSSGLVGQIPVPDASGGFFNRIYHDFYVGYDPATHQDRFYGAGGHGYYVFNVTDLAQPKLLTTVTGVAGVEWGHTFTPTPDGRYVVAEMESEFQPLRIFDLKPGLDGQVKNISRPIGAWTANWKNLSHNTEVRWPYVFVAAYTDGLYVMNLMDPTNPYTVGYFDTWDRPDSPNADPKFLMQGAWGVDVRNADGLIVISDQDTGFWAFKMEGFDGWNGHQWGMPNVSSAQDWDNGPDGAPKTGKVS